MEANNILLFVLAESPTYDLCQVAVSTAYSLSALTHPLKFTELCIQMSQTEHDPFYFYYDTCVFTLALRDCFYFSPHTLTCECSLHRVHIAMWTYNNAY